MLVSEKIQNIALMKHTAAFLFLLILTQSNEGVVQTTSVIHTTSSTLILDKHRYTYEGFTGALGDPLACKALLCFKRPFLDHSVDDHES